MARIVDYELFTVPPRWQFLRIELSDGLVGWGEPTLEGQNAAVAAAVEQYFSDHLEGRDAEDIEDHWQTMYRGGFYRGGPVLMSAIAGIDQALWDIKGRQLGTPVYELLGGKVRDRVPVYAHVDGNSTEDFTSAARNAIDTGYRNLILHPTEPVDRTDSSGAVAEIEDLLETVTNEVNDSVRIGVDLHGRPSKTMASRILSILETYDVLFVEEPVLPEHHNAITELASIGTTPIATGERLYTRWQFKQLLERTGVDIVQPNPSHAGGISETKRIGDIADAHDVGFAPSWAVGPIALASCLHLDFALHNAVIQSYRELYPEDSYVIDGFPVTFDDGYVTLEASPGLGVEIDEEAVRNRADDSIQWSMPTSRNQDGSITDW